jgi:enhancing lycopene biosynthesis protein 2
MGAKHVDTPVEEIAVDAERKLVTTAAYMLAGRISEANAGISKLVNKVLELA